VTTHFYGRPPSDALLLSVYRIQNAAALEDFTHRRRMLWRHRLDKTRPAEERLLWHGSSSLLNLEGIVGGSFRPLFAHRPGAANAHGCGAYFAKGARRADRYACEAFRYGHGCCDVMGADDVTGQGWGRIIRIRRGSVLASILSTQLITCPLARTMPRNLDHTTDFPRSRVHHSHEHGRSVRCLLLAHVVVGDTAKVPAQALPPRKPAPGVITAYETLVDDVIHPKTYVTTYDGQALPLYLVCYVINKPEANKTPAGPAVAAKPVSAAPVPLPDQGTSAGVGLTPDGGSSRKVRIAWASPRAAGGEARKKPRCSIM
jgi:hypothetical protein